MTIVEQYNELLKHRKIQPNNTLIEKQRNAWEFFRNITNVTNLEKNIDFNAPLYYAPLIKIHGSRMVSWSIQGKSEIYVDEEFAINNKEFVNIQLQHEILHNLANQIDGRSITFGYLYDSTKKNIYTGINEATTQMFTEEIAGVRLDEETDYLYFVKNIMRVMKILFGETLVADQYLNNNLDFTETFDTKTGNKFEAFAMLMNDVYSLSKEKKYRSITESQNQELEKKKQVLLDFTSLLIRKFARDDSNVIKNVRSEMNDDSFFEKLNLDSLGSPSAKHI